MKGHPRAAIAILLTIGIGVGVWHFHCPSGVSAERARLCRKTCRRQIVAVSLRETKPHLAERDGYFASFPTRPSTATPAPCRHGDAAPGSNETPVTPPPATEPRVEIKSNDACYVCHMPFVKEKLATVHAKAKVWCGTCHGPSVAHTENEYIGATPPEIVYEKPEIDRMCGRCHDGKKHPEVAAKTRLTRLAEGKRAQEAIKGRQIEPTGVCTDCHGRHWIRPRRGL